MNEPDDAALTARIAERIARSGPLRFDEVVEAALYDTEAGFYATRGSAGRHGDFITGPEVGPLFGAVIASALDTWWTELGEPDPFTVVEVGAGIGTLARAVLEARPRCGVVTDYVMVERSARLRDRQGDHLVLRGERGVDGVPRFLSSDVVPDDGFVGVTIANELLDNLAFRLAEYGDDAWSEVHVDVDSTTGRLVEHRAALDDPTAELLERLVPEPGAGARVPVQTEAVSWVDRALRRMDRGRLVVIDYASTTADMARRDPGEWLRTYRAHERGGEPLSALGTQDITCEVALDQIVLDHPAASERSQADFLVAHGMDVLVEEGRRIWNERAHVADLAALKARSRVREAEALTDPQGLGAFRVVEWVV